MRVLITGATGFLGKYMINEFAKHDCEIIAFGRNAEIGKNLKDCTFVQGDFINYQDIADAVKGVDVVIHAGALCTVWGKWQEFYDANVLGTKNVLDACIEHHVSKFVYVSSCSVYNCTYDRIDIDEEDFDPDNHLNYYIKSKIMSEKLIKETCEEHSLSYSIIRPHGIFGIGDVSIMPRLIKANGTIGIPLFNKGKNLIDIVCAENVAYSLWLCANSDKCGTYNITNGEVFEYKEMVDIIFDKIGITPRYVRISFKFAYFLTCILEGLYKLLHMKKEPIVTRYTLTTIGVSQTLKIDRAKEELGYEPQMDLQEGIEAYAEWWNSNH